jgi:predicted MPP superfamily phosphohydrolase
MNFKTKKVNIVFIGDWHLGNSYTDEKLLLETINQISKMKNTWVYLMGDLIENAINGIGIDEQYLSITYQLQQLRYYIEPIKNKIIGCILGNHEWRTTRAAQANLLKELYYGILGIPTYNFEHYFQIHVQNEKYRILVRHPSSMGTTTGWIMNLFAKASRIIAGDYDIMVFAHFHRKLIHKRNYLAMNGELRTKYDCISGHFLNYHNSYAHEKMLTPHEPGCIMATFYADKHLVEVKEF